MADQTETSARRWNGFVCPDCRFVFRVPRDHDGVGLVCPSCRRLLKLPYPGEVLPPLVLELAQEAESTKEEHAQDEIEGQEHSHRRHRHGQHRAHETPSWEREGRKPRPGRIDKSAIAGAVGLLALVAVAALYFTRPAKVAPADPGLVVAPPTDVFQPAPPVLPPVVKDAAQFNEKEFLTMADPMARKFLAATDVSQILPLIRHPEVTTPRIRSVYPDGKMTAPQLDAFNDGGLIGVTGNVVKVNVRLRDFSTKMLCFVKTPAGWQIDWENWVGWSDMNWPDFLAKKPATPQTMRVLVKSSNYYNFSFTDEKKWRSLQLVSPDGNQHVYGYAEFGSAADRALILENPTQGQPMMLELHFPADGGPNQVIIDKVVVSDWVEPEPTAK